MSDDDRVRLEDAGQRFASRRGSSWLGLILLISGPAVAFALFWISNALLYVGPLDRASFGWLVVAPIWVAPPIGAGLVMSRTDPRSSLVSATIAWAVLGLSATAIFWLEVTKPGCVETGARSGPAELIAPSLILGTVIAAGPALSGLIAAMLLRENRRWLGLVAALVVHAIALFGTAFILTVIIFTLLGCNRP